MTITHFKKGDRLPEYESQLVQGLGKNQIPIDLDNKTVHFIMKLREEPTTTKVNSVAVVVDAATGRVRYPWAPTDLDTAGEYNAEWEITFIDGRKLTVPAAGYDIIKVVEDLD